MNDNNQTTDGSFLSILLTLKENIMFSLNVAELMIVTRIDNDDVYCADINDSERTYVCAKLQNLTLKVDDVVLVIFTNKDFRSNLKKIKNKVQPQNSSMYCSHSKDNGVIVGVVYREEIENEEGEQK